MDNQVRFIRRNGRIIPIRSKKEKNKEMSGTKTFLTGIGVASAGPALGKILANRKYPEMSTESFLAKHSDMYKRAGSPDILKAHTKGAFAIFNGGKLTGMVGPQFGVNIKRKSVILGSMRAEEHYLHEMGHHEASRKKYSANRWYRKFGLDAERYFKKTRTFDKNAILLKGSLKPYIDLVAEAEASGYAIRQAHRAGGIKSAMKIASKLALPYSSYGLLGVGAAMTTYGLYKGVRNTFFRGKNER